jgi:hypothetical protein
MGATARTLTILVALFVVAMLAVPWFFPSRAGDLGLPQAENTFSDLVPSSDGASGELQVGAVTAGGPAAAAGIRAGDVLRLDLNQRIAFAEPIAGLPLEVTVSHPDGLHRVRIVPVPAPWPAIRKNLFITAMSLVYVVLGILVAWKAARAREASLILVFLLMLAFVNATDVLALLRQTPLWGYLANATEYLGVAAILLIQVVFPIVFPPRDTVTRRWIRNVGVPIAVLASLTYASIPLVVVLPSLVLAFPFHPYLFVASSLIVIVAVVEGIKNGPPAYRAQTIAAGSTLVLLSLLNIIDDAGTLLNWDTSAFDAATGWLRYAAGIGMAYAVLRHRLVDLNLVISRAAIFSVASVLLIAVFLLAEWALALVLGQLAGSRFGPQSQTVLAVLIALAVGISARSIHRAVEHRLNRVFFARRYRALADLHRFSLETDVATDANALLGLTLAVLERSIDAQYVTMYVGQPDDGYGAIYGAAAIGPARFDSNDGLILRLRRWGEAFVDDAYGAVFYRALVCPMTLRGLLYGFVVCGPKIDRTSYLPEEQETLASLVHRVGIAYEWLTRAPSGNGALAAPTVGRAESVTERIVLDA